MSQGSGPLRRGDFVHLLKNKRKYKFPDNRASVFQGEEYDECEITQAGVAGFRVSNDSTVYWWHDRGKTWSSLKLDRLDSTKDQFSKQAKG